LNGLLHEEMIAHEYSGNIGRKSNLNCNFCSISNGNQLSG